MSTKTTTENDEKTTVADRLPELTDDELALAGTNVSWAAGYIGEEQEKHTPFGIYQYKHEWWVYTPANFPEASLFEFGCRALKEDLDL